MSKKIENKRTSGRLNLLFDLWPFLKPYKLWMGSALLALLFTTVINVAIGQGVKFVIDNGIAEQSIIQFNRALGIMILLVSLQALGTFTRFYLVTSLGERVTADIRTKVFNHIVTLHPSYFEENRSGEIVSRLTTDTTLLQSIIGTSLSMALRSGLMVIAGLVMLLVTNIKLTLIVLAGVPIVLLPMLILGGRVKRLSRKSQDSIASVGTYAGEIIQQIKTVQSYNREGFEQNAFSNEVTGAYKVAKKRILQRSILIGTALFLSFAAICTMVWFGGKDVMAGHMSGGELAAFMFYAIMVAMGVATVSEVYGELQRAAGATERLMELLSVQSLIKSPNDKKKLLPHANNHLRIENLDFSYPSRPSALALQSINLKIKTGETVAIVGPSGAGKSTLFEMLLRFYDPNKGQIYLNETNIRDLDPKQVRSTMAIVPQHPILFSADAMLNIRYGKQDASEDEIVKAAKLAHAYEFIKALPQGFQSFLGESGVRLSGGQKQRIIIARAILNDPKILLLDEATSALDAESEFQVQKALEALMVNRTTLVIAHRLATVKNADRIIVMDQGKIVAKGTHSELIIHSKLYQRLAELQFISD